MKVIVAFTPAIAFSVSRALNCTDRTPEGAYTNDTGSIAIVSVPAELVTPHPMQAYTGGDDFIKTLPFIPEKYSYGLRLTDVNGRMKVSREDEELWETLQSLLASANEVIFASNGGAEEQARFAMLCQYAKVGTVTSRMWLFTLGNRAVNYAFRHRESGRTVTRTARSGMVHLGMDFLCRTNIEQAFAQSYGKKVFPMERMDIPAVWLLCNSYNQSKSVAGLAKKDSYAFTVTGKWGEATVQLAPPQVFHNANGAEGLHQEFLGYAGKRINAEIIGVENHTEWGELPFDMATLQIKVLEKYGYLPQRTMAIADTLFEKGLISSPRTSVRKMPKHMLRNIERRFPRAKGYPVRHNEEIPYCHGIITTERNPMSLTDEEQLVYSLIEKQTQAAFVAPRRYTEVQVCARVGRFEMFGTVDMPYGFVPENDNIHLTVCGVSKSTIRSSAPKPLTAAGFLKDLYSTTANPTGVPQILPMSVWHDCGGSLQRLIDNGFAEIRLDEIIPTEKARVLMARTGHLELADIGTFISQVAEGDALADNRVPTRPVVTAYEDWLAPQILSLVTDQTVFNAKVSALSCPRCGHKLTAYPSTVSCDCCGLHVPRHFHGYDLTAKDFEQLVRYKYTSPIYGFKDRNGHKYVQSLVLNYRHGLSFVPNAANTY